MNVPIMVASASGPSPDDDTPASVTIAWSAGGALRLPATTYATACAEAYRWQTCMIREGREGVIMIAC